MKNLFCNYADLRNEADVEQNFVRRLLEGLGYKDAEILPKQSLKELTVGGMRGQPKGLYRPDFAVKVGKNVRWIVEAKAPNEALDNHEWQPRAYCVLLNGEKQDQNPVLYHILTNGGETRLYKPDLNKPLMVLNFSDFETGNTKVAQLYGLVSRDKILTGSPREKETLRLSKPSLGEVNATFLWCHQYIYKKDDISQSDAFSEFVKLISLKLMSDRAIRDAHPETADKDQFEVPSDDVKFSMHWIAKNSSTRSPISDILFRQFMDDMERDIALDRRKRIFDSEDRIRLKPETISGVVKRLEGVYLFGIDTDLNGRLFETFLNATMRGKDLGQFFTPRSLVKLGVGLAQIRVDVPDGRGGKHTDTVADMCCGTGGFLIDILADMWRKVDERSSLSKKEKDQLRKEIANHRIYGVDIANAPILARIARLNMFLHGDGGSSIFHLNALDKEIKDAETDSPDITKEKRELRKLLGAGGFDTIITNPPFAKAYDRETKEEVRILDGYEIGRGSSSVRSCLLFLERYRDVLKPGGKLVTVIDDGILSGEDHQWFRAKLREWFLVRAVISLPGDAFQRSNARVKTSFLLAEKRIPGSDQDQPPVFMYPCQHVGNDDPKRQRARAGDSELRNLAVQEIKLVIAEFERFQNGAGSSQYVVQPDRVTDRLDVKNCLMTTGRMVKDWKDSGRLVIKLAELLEPRKYAADEVVTKETDEAVRVLVVRYEGIAEEAEEIIPSDGSYSKLYPVRSGDIVISNIAASYGSIAVVPEELDGCVVSSEYTVLKVKKGYDPIVSQLILRAPEIRADILLSASGANRTRTRWKLIKDILVPCPTKDEISEVRALVEEADVAKRKASAALESAKQRIETALKLRSDTASTILAAFKPPK